MAEDQDTRIPIRFRSLGNGNIFQTMLWNLDCRCDSACLFRQVNEKIPGLCGPSHSRNFRHEVSDNARLNSSLRLSNVAVLSPSCCLIVQALAKPAINPIFFVPSSKSAHGGWLVTSPSLRSISSCSANGFPRISAPVPIGPAHHLCPGKK